MYVNGSSDEIIWSLGGKQNSFASPKNDGSNHLLTHDAHFPTEDLSIVTYYDNTVMVSSTGCKANCTKGRMVKLDYTNMQSTLIESFYHPQSLQGGPEGSYGTLPNGNVLIGWGAQPSITEYIAKNNTCVFNVQFAIFNVGPDNYRSYKANWLGEPTWNPAIASSTEEDGSKVWVSWNGATEVRQWTLVSLPL